MISTPSILFLCQSDWNKLEKKIVMIYLDICKDFYAVILHSQENSIWTRLNNYILD